MDKMRWRYGDTNPVVAAVLSDTEVEIGDLVAQSEDHAVPKGDESTHLFARNFLGVAMQRSRVGDTDPLRVATTGVFEFDCAPLKFSLGDKVGAEEKQKVKPVDSKTEAIARVAKVPREGMTSILVDIKSTIMTGGIVDND